MSVIRKVILAAAVSLFALLVMFSGTPTAAKASPLWTDLPDDLLANYGLTQDDIGSMSNGYPDHTWPPGKCMTRGQFVRFALSYFRIFPDYIGNVYQHFTDVPRDSPYYGWVETAFHVGLIQGYTAPSSTEATVFGLYDLVTREQAVTILMRYLSKTEPSTFDYSAYTTERVNQLLAPFADSHQVRRPQEIAMALDINVLRPPGAAITPEASVTRIQAAALIARAHGLLPSPTEEPPSMPDHVLSWLSSDAYVAGIQAETFQLGSLAPWMPRELTVKARVAPDQDPAVYQGIAEKLVSLADKYKGVMKYEQVRVLLITEGGALVYDHTFAETAASLVSPAITWGQALDIAKDFEAEHPHVVPTDVVPPGDIKVTVRSAELVETDAPAITNGQQMLVWIVKLGGTHPRGEIRATIYIDALSGEILTHLVY